MSRIMMGTVRFKKSSLCGQGMSVMELQTVLRNYTYSGFPIVADSNRLVGFITRQDLENGLTQSVKHHNGENCIQGKR